MATDTIRSNHFTFACRERTFSCERLLRGNQEFYRVSTGKSQLFVTRAKAANGEPFWTPVPEDEKLFGLVMEMGAEIEKYYK